MQCLVCTCTRCRKPAEYEILDTSGGKPILSCAACRADLLPESAFIFPHVWHGINTGSDRTARSILEARWNSLPLTRTTPRIKKVKQDFLNGRCSLQQALCELINSPEA